MSNPANLTGNMVALGSTTGPIKIEGPYISSAGNVYIVGRDATTGTTLRVDKCAGDPNSNSFSQIATKTGYTTGILCVRVFQVSDVLHIIVADGTDGTSTNYKYATFNMATDAFVLAETIASALSYAGQTLTTLNSHCDIVVRSGGEVVVGFVGTATKTGGKLYARAYYSRRTGTNTWSAATQVDGSQAGDISSICAIWGRNNDRVHFCFSTAGFTSNVRTLSSANVLQTTVSFTGMKCTWGKSYDNGSGGTQCTITGFNTSSGDLACFTSADAVTIVYILLTDTAYNGGGTACAPSIALPDDAINKLEMFGTITTNAAQTTTGISEANTTNPNGLSGITHLTFYWEAGGSQIPQSSATGNIQQTGGKIYTRGSNVIFGWMFLANVSGSKNYYQEWVIRTLAQTFNQSCTVQSAQSVTKTASHTFPKALTTIAIAETVSLARLLAHNLLSTIPFAQAISTVRFKTKVATVSVISRVATVFDKVATIGGFKRYFPIEAISQSSSVTMTRNKTSGFYLYIYHGHRWVGALTHYINNPTRFGPGGRFGNNIKGALTKSLTINWVELLSAVPTGSGTTNPQVIPMASAQSVTLTLLRTIVNAILVSSAEAVTLAKSVAHTVLIASAHLITTIKATTHQIVAMLSPQSVTANMRKPKNVVLSSGETVTLASIKALSKAISVASAETVTLAKSAAHAITATISSLITTARATAHALIVVNASTVTLAKVAAHLKSITVSSAELVTLARQLAFVRTITIASAELITLARSMAHTIAVSLAQTITLPRRSIKTIGVVSGQAITLGRALSHQLVATLSQVIALGRSIAKNIYVAGSQAVTLARTFIAGSVQHPLTITITQSSAVSTGKKVLHAISVALAQSVFALRSVGHSASLFTSEAVTLGRSIGHSITSLSAQNVTVEMRHTFAAVINLITSQAVSLGNSIAHLVSIAQASVVTLPGRLKAGLKAIPTITSGELVTLARGRGKSVTVSSAETVTLIRKVTKIISFGVAQSVSIANRIGHGIVVAMSSTVTLVPGKKLLRTITVSSSELVTLARLKAFTRTITTIASGQSVKLARQIAKPINAATTLVVTLARKVLKPIALATSSVVSLSTTAAHVVRATVSQASAITLARLHSVRKAITTSSSQLVTLARTSSRQAIVSIATSSSVTIRRAISKTISVAVGPTVSLSTTIAKAITAQIASLMSVIGTAAHQVSLAVSTSAVVSVGRTILISSFVATSSVVTLITNRFVQSVVTIGISSAQLLLLVLKRIRAAARLRRKGTHLIAVEERPVLMASVTEDTLQAKTESANLVIEAEAPKLKALED